MGAPFFWQPPVYIYKYINICMYVYICMYTLVLCSVELKSGCGAVQTSSTVNKFTHRNFFTFGTSFWPTKKPCGDRGSVEHTGLTNWKCVTANLYAGGLGYWLLLLQSWQWMDSAAPQVTGQPFSGTALLTW